MSRLNTMQIQTLVETYLMPVVIKSWDDEGIRDPLDRPVSEREVRGLLKTAVHAWQQREMTDEK